MASRLYLRSERDRLSWPGAGCVAFMLPGEKTRRADWLSVQGRDALIGCGEGSVECYCSLGVAKIMQVWRVATEPSGGVRWTSKDTMPNWARDVCKKSASRRHSSEMSATKIGNFNSRCLNWTGFMTGPHEGFFWPVARLIFH